MPAYEAAGFQPPAAVVRARIVGPAGSRSDVPLMIDSGADVSVVPLDAATAVGATIVRSTTAIQFLAGGEILLDQTDIAVEFLRYRFRGAFLVVDSAYGVIGRNILNALKLTLDGPQLEWSVADSASPTSAGEIDRGRPQGLPRSDMTSRSRSRGTLTMLSRTLP